MYTYLASAYPNSALSAGALTAIALVAAATLALWLVLVFRAEKSNEKNARRAHSHLTVMAQSDDAAEDRTSEAGTASADRPHGAAA